MIPVFLISWKEKRQIETRDACVIYFIFSFLTASSADASNSRDPILRICVSSSRTINVRECYSLSCNIVERHHRWCKITINDAIAGSLKNFIPENSKLPFYTKIFPVFADVGLAFNAS